MFVSYNSLVYKVIKAVLTCAGNITWNWLHALFNDGLYYSLTKADHAELRKLLASNYYIILISRKAHLTTYLVGLASLVKDGKWSSWSHALMNVDNVTDPTSWDQFKLMEATSTGVHWSTFMEVFDCDAVCLLKPKNVTLDDWTEIIDGLTSQEGLPYDDLFELTDASHVSCVELVLNALKAMPTYREKLPSLEASIEKVGNLTPQMFYDSDDFEIVLELHR